MSRARNRGVEHNDTKSDGQQARWFWTGVVALVMILAAGGIAAVGHGDAQVLKGVQIAAAVICVGSFFRWAVLRERARSTDKG